MQDLPGTKTQYYRKGFEPIQNPIQFRDFLNWTGFVQLALSDIIGNSRRFLRTPSSSKADVRDITRNKDRHHGCHRRPYPLTPESLATRWSIPSWKASAMWDTFAMGIFFNDMTIIWEIWWNTAAKSLEVVRRISIDIVEIGLSTSN